MVIVKWFQTAALSSFCGRPNCVLCIPNIAEYAIMCLCRRRLRRRRRYYIYSLASSSGVIVQLSIIRTMMKMFNEQSILSH